MDRSRHSTDRKTTTGRVNTSTTSRRRRRSANGIRVNAVLPRRDSHGHPPGSHTRCERNGISGTLGIDREGFDASRSGGRSERGGLRHRLPVPTRLRSWRAHTSWLTAAFSPADELAQEAGSEIGGADFAAQLGALRETAGARWSGFAACSPRARSRKTCLSSESGRDVRPDKGRYIQGRCGHARNPS